MYAVNNIIMAYFTSAVNNIIMAYFTLEIASESSASNNSQT